MDENVNGCYAQKPLKCIERIVQASSNENDLVIDFFSHSGTTAIASAKLKRRCFTMNVDPIFYEITIRRIERFLETGKTGWQNSNPFEEDLGKGFLEIEESGNLPTKPKSKAQEHFSNFMEKLREQLDKLVLQLENAAELHERLEEFVSVYPFNDFEFIISHLLGAEKLTIEDYYEIRQNYIMKPELVSI